MAILNSYLSKQIANPPEMFPQFRLVNVRIDGESIVGTTCGDDDSLFYNPFDSYNQESEKGNAPRPVHLEFADLDPADRYETARGFISKYGPLVSRFPRIRFKNARYYPLFFRISLNAFWKAQQCFADTVRLVESFQNYDPLYEAMRLIGIIEKKCAIKHEFRFETLSEEEARPIDVINFLIIHIGDYLKDIHPAVTFLGSREDWIKQPLNKLSFHIMPKRQGLLSICYMMLAWDLCENHRIATCKNEMCRKRYLRLPSNKMFCSSECAARTAKRDWARRHRKAANSGH